MSRREVQHLIEAGAKGAAPRANDTVHGGDLVPRGRGTETFKRFAVVGAIMGAGVPLFSAARLAKVIVKAEFNQEDGEAPSGLNYLATKLSRDEIERFLPSQAVDTNDYHYHLALTHMSGYERGKALGSDALMEIIDRSVIMISSIQFPKWEIAGWIENWGRASEVDITLASERAWRSEFGQKNVNEVNWTTEVTQAVNRQYAALQAEAERTRQNAIAKITINLSLAIRNAFDRLYDHRAQTGRAAKEQLV